MPLEGLTLELQAPGIDINEATFDAGELEAYWRFQEDVVIIKIDQLSTGESVLKWEITPEKSTEEL